MHAIINKAKSELAPLISSQEYSQECMKNSREVVKSQLYLRLHFCRSYLYVFCFNIFVKWCALVARIFSNTHKYDGTLISCETSKSFRSSYDMPFR